MGAILLSGSGNLELAASIARELGTRLGKVVLERFPDAELHVEVLEDVRSRDVVIIQSLRPPAESYLLELLLLADAARRSGARSLAAAIPYFAYARQDRRVTGRESLGARVVADMLQDAGIQRVLALDLHSSAVEAAFRIPVEHLSATALLATRLRATSSSEAVLVSPDLGGAKRAERFGKLLGLPVVVVHKQRLSGSEVSTGGVAGVVRGRSPVVVDDMVSTGGTVEAAAKALLDAGCAARITIAATHCLLVQKAVEKLAGLPIQRLLTTDSLPLDKKPSTAVERLSVAPLFADAIRQWDQPGRDADAPA